MEVSKEEAEIICQGNCPCGGCLLKGPYGGLSVNVKCDTCNQRFNIPPRPFLPERLAAKSIKEKASRKRV